MTTQGETTTDTDMTVGQTLERLGEPRRNLTVRMSRELITLLSEQLYTSPSKAVEELVVNSFDADARNTWVVVPAASSDTEVAALPVIAVFDDGAGMDEAGLSDLWRVGASTKRTDHVARIRQRTQIGKFGIGKLATYALAKRITYITCTGNGDILSVSLSYETFHSDASDEADEPVELIVRKLTTDELLAQPVVQQIFGANGLPAVESLSDKRHWTLVLLEDFKSQAQKLTPGRLRWVLSTAMPVSDFVLHLNGETVTSRKQQHLDDAPIRFDIVDLTEARLARLNERTGRIWSVETFDTDGGQGERLICDLLPNGVTGYVAVTERPIYAGKSNDLGRSHGFFVRVRGRLISEDDPLFGLTPLSYEVFNRLYVEVNVDDIDEDLTAPREGAGTTDRVIVLQELLNQLFNEGRIQFTDYGREQDRKRQETKQEDKRQYVYPRFVERPVADALLVTAQRPDSAPTGPDADEDWFYLAKPDTDRVTSLATELYGVESREPFHFEYEETGRTGRLVSFDPDTRTFIVNAEHELSLAFADTKVSRDLLNDVAIAEALLEVYLREAGLAAHLVGEILERRDGLLRSLAREHVNSPAAIAAILRDATNQDRDLEIAMVIAARALGFVAKHIGNADRPDGLARFSDYPNGERKITLEAKSSADVPSLSALDFAGLHAHKLQENADGCLVIAPSYPGGSRGENAQAAQRAINAQVSCWTIDQLARVVASLNTRDITARDVLDIVLNKFTPEEVTCAVDELLDDPTNAPRELAVAILDALRNIEKYVAADSVRRVHMLPPELGRMELFPSPEEVERAVKQLVGASSGALTLMTDGRIIFNTSFEELERRTAAWASNVHSNRHGSTFHRAEQLPDAQ